MDNRADIVLSYTDFELALAALDQDRDAIKAACDDLAKIFDPTHVPADLLPYLAWQHSVDVWHDDWSESQKRRVVAAAYALHKAKGSRDAVERAVAAVGLDIAIEEWFDQVPQGPRGTFKVTLSPKPDSDLSQVWVPENFARIRELINGAKPLSRSWTQHLAHGGQLNLDCAVGSIATRIGKAQISIDLRRSRMSGGTVSSDTTYTYFTFTSSGNLQVDGNAIEVDYLLVGGGGAGGPGNDLQGGGGGGAGGVLSGRVRLGTGSHQVIVGSGGTPRRGADEPSLAESSTFFGFEAFPGGAGADAGVGGSWNLRNDTPFGGESTHPAQGHAGGNVYSYTTAGIDDERAPSGASGGGGSSYRNLRNTYTGGFGAGGGGGAGGVGSNAPSRYNGGSGGVGLDFSDWTPVAQISADGHVGGGGGGGSDDNGVGGSGGDGGGGAGAEGSSATHGVHGVPNTGGGAGGGADQHGNNEQTLAGNGGSGLLIVRVRSESVEVQT